MEILKKLEDKLNLLNLSELEVQYMTHEDFSNIDKNKLSGKYWLVVTDYPVNESFYDTQGKGNGHTSKFEIFLTRGFPNRSNIIPRGGGIKKLTDLLSYASRAYSSCLNTAS